MWSLRQNLEDLTQSQPELRATSSCPQRLHVFVLSCLHIYIYLFIYLLFLLSSLLLLFFLFIQCSCRVCTWALKVLPCQNSAGPCMYREASWSLRVRNEGSRGARSHAAHLGPIYMHSRDAVQEIDTHTYIRICIYIYVYVYVYVYLCVFEYHGT